MVLCKDGYRAIRNVGFKEAVRAARKGENVWASSKRGARQVADAAGGGAKKPTRDPAHIPGSSPHYHPKPRTGSHIFYTIASGLTISSYVQCDDCLSAKLAAVGDFFNPLSIGKDVMDLFDAGEE